jgi:hypothetical protein
MTTVAAKVNPQKSKKVSFKLQGKFTGEGDLCQMNEGELSFEVGWRLVFGKDLKDRQE